MKKLVTIYFIIFLIAGLFVPQQIKAQSPPQKMSYQAVIRDGNNVLITSTTVGMKISILQGAAMGGITPVYVETQTPTSNINGLVSLEVGSGTVVSGTFASIDWANGPFYIKTETDPTGGTNYTITGTSQLLSVPYAFYAKTAENGVTSAQANEIAANTLKVGYTEALVSANTDVVANTAKVGLTPGTALGQMQYWNGTAWVTVAAGQNGQILKFKNGVPTWSDGNINDLSIGDYYQGGIIAYFLVSGDPGYDANVKHGLIAATADQSSGAQWYNDSNTTTGAIATALGTGSTNTSTIISNQGTGTYAATICDNYAGGGYTDWYLPSKDELNKLYLNRVAVGGFASVSVSYWSSTEGSNSNAWLQIFGITGLQGSYFKSLTVSVRAIRSF